MNRLTRKIKGYYSVDLRTCLPMEYEQIENSNACVDKLGRLEDIEEELGIDLITLLKASSFGFYSKENNEITYKRSGVVIVGKYLVETKPVYAVKETTLNSSYYGDVESMKIVDNAYYWEWKTCKHWEIKNYGKTWALTKEELENDN